MQPRLIARPLVASRLDVPPVTVQQAGCFTRAQARAAGFGDYRQRLLLQSGRWRVVLGTVLAHADEEPTPWLRAHAAVLGAGRYRAVSHSTAAALWGWDVDEDLHVIRPGGRIHPRIAEHRVRLGSGEVVVASGLRITTLDRTIEDVITGFDQRRAVAALAEGFRQGRFAPGGVLAAAERAHGRTGAPRARDLAWSCRGGPFSVLEWDFHQVAWSVDPHGWSFNVPIRDAYGLIGYVDALHEPTGTVVELDGFAFHADRFHADRTRDQRLAALGLLCVRLTSEDLRSTLLITHRLAQILAGRVGGPTSTRGIGPRSSQGFDRGGAGSWVC